MSIDDDWRRLKHIRFISWGDSKGIFWNKWHINLRRRGRVFCNKRIWIRNGCWTYSHGIDWFWPWKVGGYFNQVSIRKSNKQLLVHKKNQHVTQVQCLNGLKTVLDDMPRQCALLHYAQDSASESSELSIRKSNMVTASAGVVCEFPKHQEEQQPTNEEQD